MAIEQLVSDKTTERLGGIYALEHVMRESHLDHDTIVEVLAAFIRERSPIINDDLIGYQETESSSDELPTQRPKWVRRPPSDVRAALAVLHRRPPRGELHPIDLELADLRGAELPGAQLQRADLHGAQLNLAWLVGANLESANLQGAQLTAYLLDAQLQNADLQDAYMPEARLNRADLRQARLMRANMRGATLVDAQLQDANLGNADLHDAELL